MTPEEIAEYNQNYIESYMEYYSDDMTPSDDDEDDTVLDIVEHISASKIESRSSKRSWMLYEKSEENPNTCRNCPRRAATRRCPLEYIALTSCAEGNYHRHPRNAEIRIKETMPNGHD